MTHTTTRRQGGFTLIELMITIAIVGILAAIAVPAYLEYAVRAKVSEGIRLGSPGKVAIAEYYASEGTLPTNNTQAGLPTSTSITGDYVSSVTVTSAGRISIAYNSAERKISGTFVELVPSAGVGSVNFRCDQSGTTVPDKYLPPECRQ